MNATSQQGYRHSWEGEVLVVRVREGLVTEPCRRIRPWMGADERSGPSGKVIDNTGKAWEAVGRAAWLTRGLGRRVEADGPKEGI